MRLFSKSERSTFSYWFAHWCAFQMTAILTGHWRVRFLLHDWYKPWMNLMGVPYKTIQKIHRANSRHHIEYVGPSNKKDYDAMMIDWECSRLTKESCPLTAFQEAIKKRIDFIGSYDGIMIYKSLYKLGLLPDDHETYHCIRKVDVDGSKDIGLVPINSRGYCSLDGRRILLNGSVVSKSELSPGPDVYRITSITDTDLIMEKLSFNK